MSRNRIVLMLLTSILLGCQGKDPAVSKIAAAQPAIEKEVPRSEPKMTEESFRRSMALEDVEEIRYIGDDGIALSFLDFLSVVQSGRSFKKEVEADKSLAVMTINPKDLGRPDSSETEKEPNALLFPISAELPPIKNKDLENKLNVLANGKSYTLVSFFFADCVPCIQEIPALNSLANASDKLKVVSITFEPQKIASEFSKKRGLKTSIIPDSQDYIDALGVKVYPTLILVSPEGRLMGVRSSYKVTDKQDSGLNEIRAWINSLGLKT